VLIAAHEIGTGVRTVVAQMAAERLCIPVSAVTVETGDSKLPPSPVAGGLQSDGELLLGLPVTSRAVATRFCTANYIELSCDVEYRGSTRAAQRSSVVVPTRRLGSSRRRASPA
jgi:hypothetical protein